MMLGLSNNTVIVLDRRGTILTLHLMDFASSKLKPLAGGSHCSRRVTCSTRRRSREQ
jgi:hypothetical protein